MDKIKIPVHQTVLSSLAIVGFVVLVSGGIWLALDSTRFVPPVVNRLGAAAVYFGSLFTPASPAPVASTTIPFEGNDNLVVSTSTSTVTSTPSKPKKPTAGGETSGAYPIGGSGTPTLFGLSDLTVQINAVGYLTAASADSFVASSTVPSGGRPAVKFTIKNIGTNATGSWRFSASIPTQSSYIFQSQPQQSLNPGDSIDYILGFDQAILGANKIISITANFDRTIGESNMNNNVASTTVTLLGS
jgi:hypothetical protein